MGGILKRQSDNRGFTLIELIVSLLIFGVLGVFMGIGFVSSVEGFFFTKKNADTTMKTQVALTRLMKEFSTIETVHIGSQTAMTYDYNKNGSTVSNRAVFWSGTPGDPLLLGANTLLDNIHRLTLTYYSSHSDAGDHTWHNGDNIIGITLQIKGAADTVSSFLMRVVPRNLYNPDRP